MAKIWMFFVLFFSLLCWGPVGAQEKFNHNKPSREYVAAGQKITDQSILTARGMEEKYDALKPGDTLNVSFKGEVTAVCKNKGCWMKMALEDGREVMVRFKDYAFFVPSDIENGTAVINGKAYVEEMSVEEQRHFAKDEGRSPDEISDISNPRKTLSFIADGVRIKKEL